MGNTTNAIEPLLAQAAWVRRLARSLVREDADAEDAIQDTWLSAVRRPPTMDAPLRGWLATVLRRHVAQRATRDSRRMAREQTVAPPAGAVSSAEELAERVGVQKVLADIVMELEEPYRQTVLLRYYEEKSAAEIGRLLGIPGGTVRWRLKTALDQVRKRLDERYGGERRVWMLAVAPLLRRGRPMLAAAAMISGALVVTGAMTFLVPSMRPSPMTTDPGTGRLASGASPSLPPRFTLAGAAVPTELQICRREVERLYQITAAAEAEARKNLSAETLFDRGDPNPGAEAELAPTIVRIMKGEGARPPSYTLECRTWMCRMIVVGTEVEATPERTNRWMLALQKDPEMTARTSERGFRTRGRSRDSLSGELLARKDVYLRLKDATGKSAVQDGAVRLEAAMSLPATRESCRIEITALRERLARSLSEGKDYTTPRRRLWRFEISAPDLATTAEVTTIVRRLMVGRPDADQYGADCRADVCKMTLPSPRDEWRRAVMRDAALKGRTFGEAHMRDGGDYVLLKSLAERRADAWVQSLIDGLETRPAVATCGRLHDGTGELRVLVRLEVGTVDVPAKLTAGYGGNLADTPLSRCVARIVDEMIVGAVPPDGLASGAARATLSFPAKAK